MTVGERIKELREHEMISISKLEKDSGVSNISRIENNVTLPGLEAIKLLCNYFGVTSDWLIFGGLSNVQTEDGEKKAEVTSDPDLAFAIQILTDLYQNEGPDMRGWAKITFQNTFDDYIAKKNRRSSSIIA